MNSFLSDWKTFSVIPNKLIQLSHRGSLPGYYGGARVNSPISRRKFQSSDDIERNCHSNSTKNIPISKSILYSTNDTTITSISENPESPLNGNLFPGPFISKITLKQTYLSSLLLTKKGKGVGLIVKAMLPPKFESSLPFAYKIIKANCEKGFLIFKYEGIPLNENLQPIQDAKSELIDDIYSYGLKWKIIY